MAIELLNLDEGGASLEFTPEDAARVRAAITQLFGEIEGQWSGPCAEVQFGGESFAFQNEWDDPCLIASDAQGVAMLRRLAEVLIG